MKLCPLGVMLSGFPSSSPVAGNAEEAFLIRSLCPSFCPFSFMFCIRFCGLGLEWTIREIKCHWGVWERGERFEYFSALLKSEKKIFHLYKCFSAVGKKFCSCRALDKPFQLTWLTLILKCLGHFWSFTDKICFRKLIFPRRYWLLAGLGKNNLFILLAAHCFQTGLRCNLFLYSL